MKWQTVVFSVVLGVITFAHLWQLGNLPKGLHNDEASIGINAYSVSQNLRDEHNVFLPLYFKAFGEYKSPFNIYPTALLFKLFGVSEFTLRLTSFIWWAVFIIFFLSLTIQIADRRFSTIVYSLLVAAFLPWFFPISRIAIETIISQLALTTLSLYLLFLALHRHFKPIWALSAGLILGLSSLSYSTSRLWSILAFILLLATYHGRFYLRPILIITIGFFIGLMPYGLYLLHHSGNLTFRFKEVSYLSNSSLTSATKFQLFMTNYLHYLSPGYLLFSGDTNPRHHAGQAGEIYLSVAFLFLLGLMLILATPRLPHRRFWVYLIICLVFAPVPAALTTGDSSLRSLMVGLYISLISLAGLNFIHRSTDAHLRHILVILILSLTLAESAIYLYHYFVIYPAVSAGAFEGYDYRQVLIDAARYHPREIIASDRLLAPYAQLEFYRILLNQTSPPARVAVPIARLQSCIITNPFNDTIDNPQHLVPTFSSHNYFIHLTCY